MRLTKVGPCIASRRRLLRLSTASVLSLERYYVAHVDRAPVKHHGMSACERDRIKAHRWWPVDELVQSHEIIVPLGVVELIQAISQGNCPSHPVTIDT
jgi:hypothetical protein